ncbi:MAG: class I SAM-dependent methyltransferase [Beijerinckiaceae bacterium]|nr:class I SAM-dependent methyltransferase [Beijerinckiaceae bacterium]MCI0734840.1 class I SAM-dependent methyltransferase [Beijerinckiaceae bacterium]
MTEAPLAENSYSISIHDQIKRSCPRLHPGTNAILAEMYRADELYGTECDRPVTINKLARVTIRQGAMMNKLMRSFSIQRSLEVGLGYGFSTVWMLDALRPRRNALHAAIDPYQKSFFKGIGLTQVKRLESGARFEWIEDFSIHALSGLIRQGEKFDFVFIDGNHRFDDVIVDFYLSDQIVRIGGLIALDDIHMTAVRTAANFIVANRSYQLIPQPADNMLVLRKTRDDDRDWRHFKGFEVEWPPEVAARLPPESRAAPNGIARFKSAFRGIF